MAMKSVLFGASALVLAASMVGCGGDDTVAGTTKKPATDSGVVDTGVITTPPPNDSGMVTTNPPPADAGGLDVSTLPPPSDTGSSGGGWTFMNGYALSGPWKGYTFTFVDTIGSTVKPVCGTTGTCFMTAGTKACATGTVKADMAYGGFAGFGWNINQGTAPPDGSTMNPQNNVTLGGSGVNVDVTNNAGSTLRVQITVGTGATAAIYCATLSGSGPQMVPFSMFNTKCWDGTGTAGTALVGAMVSQVELVVPGTNMTDTPFDFCVNNIAPAN